MVKINNTSYFYHLGKMSWCQALHDLAEQMTRDREDCVNETRKIIHDNGLDAVNPFLMEQAIQQVHRERNLAKPEEEEDPCPIEQMLQKERREREEQMRDATGIIQKIGANASFEDLQKAYDVCKFFDEHPHRDEEEYRQNLQNGSRNAKLFAELIAVVRNSGLDKYQEDIVKEAFDAVVIQNRIEASREEFERTIALVNRHELHYLDRGVFTEALGKGGVHYLIST